MSSVLVVNAGSSSLKLALLDPADEVTAALAIDHWDGESDHDELRDFLTTQRQIAAVGHRVVHGGAELTRATVIDEPVLTQIKALTDLAPLHQPRALAAIAAARALLPQVPQVACFDTAFHATLPPAARAYALPAAWTVRYGLRRYGFHGLSHAYAARRCAQLLEIDPQQLRVVTCHLGAGSSLAAVSGGISVDTTMGFTGGIGEHQPQVRAEAAAGLGFLGVAIDPGRNQAAAGDCDISSAPASVRTMVVAAREDLEIARQVRAVLGPAAGPPAAAHPREAP